MHNAHGFAGHSQDVFPHLPPNQSNTFVSHHMSRTATESEAHTLRKDAAKTAAQSKALEAIQRRAMRIIFAHSDYEMALMLAGLDPLEARRARLTERFFRRRVLSEVRV